MNYNYESIEEEMVAYEEGCQDALESSVDGFRAEFDEPYWVGVRAVTEGDGMTFTSDPR